MYEFFLKRLNRQLQRQIDRLRWENLKLRIEIEELTGRPDGSAAKSIKNKYLLKRKIRHEIDLMLQN